MGKTAENCQTMADIRLEIDRIDRALMALFAERWGYIGRAAEIKGPQGLKADIPERVEEVVANAGRNAVAAGLEPEFYQAIWRQLIAQSIAHEKAILGEKDEDGSAR